MPDPLVSLADRRDYANALIDVFNRRIDELAANLGSGQMTIGDWQIAMREELRKQNAMMLITGAGGDKSTVAANDWLKLGSELKKQYGYLEDFAHAIVDSEMSMDAITARARLYTRSTRATFWRQAMPVKLPAQPGDGSTECVTNCDCEWQLDYEYDEAGNVTAVLATWTLGAVEAHCETCKKRASEWAPLRIPVDGNEIDDSYKQMTLGELYKGVNDAVQSAA